MEKIASSKVRSKPRQEVKVLAWSMFEEFGRIKKMKRYGNLMIIIEKEVE